MFAAYTIVPAFLACSSYFWPSVPPPTTTTSQEEMTKIDEKSDQKIEPPQKIEKPSWAEVGQKVRNFPEISENFLKK